MERAGADAELVAGAADAPFPLPPQPRTATARIAAVTSKAKTMQGTALWWDKFIA